MSDHYLESLANEAAIPVFAAPPRRPQTQRSTTRVKNPLESGINSILREGITTQLPLREVCVTDRSRYEKELIDRVKIGVTIDTDERGFLVVNTNPTHIVLEPEFFDVGRDEQHFLLCYMFLALVHFELGPEFKQEYLRLCHVGTACLEDEQHWNALRMFLLAPILRTALLSCLKSQAISEGARCFLRDEIQILAQSRKQYFHTPSDEMFSLVLQTLAWSYILKKPTSGPLCYVKLREQGRAQEFADWSRFALETLGMHGAAKQVRRIRRSDTSMNYIKQCDAFVHALKTT